jgi:hypothetical protein
MMKVNSKVMVTTVPPDRPLAKPRRPIFVSVGVNTVALGGLMVSVLATGPKVRGFKPGRGRWFLG